ncbi:MAG: M20/M25/M40 family metallo-hydrolase, partial [Spongiibacteraceae bacterium]
GWSYPPYAGTIADGYIWGRGAIDDKASVIGILEAVNRALTKNFTPERTIYLAFGDDEEVGGTGAMAVAALLKERGESLAFLLDEGGIIAKDLVPGMTSRVALLGPGEKGYVSLKLITRRVGGHASMPPANTAAGIIGRAVARLEDQPFPANIDLTVELFRFLGDELPYWQRLLFANSWLFSPLLESVLSKNPSTNAGIRTTTAVTMLQGSVKDNVLPIEASAVVNFRILPGESIASVRAHVAQIIDDDRVTIENYGFASEPSTVAATDSPGFKVLSEVINQVSPDVVIAPRLVVAATDARHFEEVADNSYRFIGVEVGPHELKGIHGTDERVSIQSYAEAVKIYYQLILRSAEL